MGLNKRPCLFMRLWFLCEFVSRSHRLGCFPQRLTLLPAPLGQLHYHGSQLRGVGADRSISDGWSNGADAQQELAAIVVRGHAALVNQGRPRLGALDNVRQRCSTCMFLNGEKLKVIPKSLVAVKCRYWRPADVKDDCTSRLWGSGLGSPLGDTLSGGASRVLSKSSAKRMTKTMSTITNKKRYLHIRKILWPHLGWEFCPLHQGQWCHCEDRL